MDERIITVLALAFVVLALLWAVLFLRQIAFEKKTHGTFRELSKIIKTSMGGKADGSTKM